MTKKQTMLKSIKNNPDISDTDHKWIKQEFLPHLQRSGATTPATQANYLQAIDKIAETENFQLTELENQNISEVNKKVADSIRNSEYRKTRGENAKRRKRHQWTTWQKLLDCKDIDAEIPEVKFSKSKDVNRQADTKPKDLPTPEQCKNFVRKLGEKSGESVKLRNQALIMLMWDKGPRIGEALSIKMKHVNVKGKIVEIEIPGNKGSKDRKVTIFQGRKLLKDYVEKHPAKDNRDAYLFGKLKHQSFEQQLGKKPLRRKIHQVHSSGDFDFKVHGEPFHIFRKAMVTSHIVNEWATWEEICTWQGKKADATKPDYLKMALSDVDANVAERIGASIDVSGSGEGHRMVGDPLLPVKCLDCDRLNRCLNSVCGYCGSELPESTMPGDEEKEQLKQERSMFQQMAAEVGMTQSELAEKMGFDPENLEQVEGGEK